MSPSPEPHAGRPHLEALGGSELPVSRGMQTAGREPRRGPLALGGERPLPLRSGSAGR